MTDHRDEAHGVVPEDDLPPHRAGDYGDAPVGPRTPRPSPGFTPRARAAVLVALMIVALPAGGIIDIAVQLRESFPTGGPNLDRTGVLIGFLVGAAVGVGFPVVVAVREVRARRRDRTRSRVVLIASLAILAIAVPTHGMVLTYQTRKTVELALQKAQPPTELERRTEERDVQAELAELGDETVRALGADPDLKSVSGERAGGVRRDSCHLDNLSSGVEWTYSYDWRSTTGPDGTQPAPGAEAAPTATGDVAAVVELWESRGVRAVTEGEEPGRFRAEADWLRDYPTVYPGPIVLMVTTCFVET
ncbi:hypothetical protein [Frigoribacterium sp. R86507]|uniref:hypothetical protein n=1 Tax=Frigoribacterium sp. R86507 TaxID=3093850 RepID=UPI0037CC39A9